MHPGTYAYAQMEYTHIPSIPKHLKLGIIIAENIHDFTY